MKNYYLKERDTLEHSRKNAGSKARNDVETIVEELGYEPIDVVLPYKDNKSVLSSVIANVRIYRYFKKRLSFLQNGDSLLVQFPPRSHSVLFPPLFRKLRKNGVTIAFLVHDLERMRYRNLSDVRLKKRIRITLEETVLLRESDRIICHNEKMKTFLCEQSIPENKLVPLGIFDYLTDCEPVLRTELPKSPSVLIAGNLSPEKCVYITELQDIPEVNFKLYGVGYRDLSQPNVTYCGSFMPDELVGELQGTFGLVWDGTTINTCSGIFGNYLKLNDPHKLSLYLTAGLPVVVWKEAAVADFVQQRNVGIAVSSLQELPSVIGKLTEGEYAQMSANACNLSAQLRAGAFLKAALSN